MRRSKKRVLGGGGGGEEEGGEFHRRVRGITYLEKASRDSLSLSRRPYVEGGGEEVFI